MCTVMTYNYVINKYLPLLDAYSISRSVHLASGVVSLHFEVKHGGCLIPLLTGKPETGQHIYPLNTTTIILSLSRKNLHHCTGKSTAAKLAAAICGQQHVGHIMKTHSTSDSLCNERLVRTSLLLFG